MDYNFNYNFNETNLQITSHNMFLLNWLDKFENLEDLTICLCPIKSIEYLPNSLKILEIHSNHFLETICNLPNNLEKLYLSRNSSLKKIPKIVSSRMNNCQIHSNGLEELELDTPVLEILDCSNNKLKQLLRLPNSLGSLNCSKNLIEKINIPPNISFLDCSNNKIKEFASIPDKLDFLFCQGNPLLTTNTDELRTIIKFRDAYYRGKYSKRTENRFLEFIKRRKYDLHSELIYDPKRNFYKELRVGNW